MQPYRQHLTATDSWLLVVGCLVIVGALAVPVVAGDEPEASTAVEHLDTGIAGDVLQPTTEGVATVDGTDYDSLSAADNAATAGDRIVVTGLFEERPEIATDDVQVVAGESGAVIDGGGTDRVVTISGENVTVEGIAVRDSGDDLGSEDAGIFVAGDGSTIRTVHIAESAFGIWVDGADDVTIEDVRIEGQADVHPRTERGNGIQLFETDGTVVRDCEITGVRDGIYFSWATNVRAENNSLWNNRYGVHYMYSDDNQLVDNAAVDNGVGYALMVSEGLSVRNNTAIRNTDTSGHGVLVKDVERSDITGNTLVGNENGLYVYNAQDNEITDNLVVHNAVGIHSTAGSEGQTVAGNSFVGNGRTVVTTRQSLVAWNTTDGGNYWSDTQVADRTGDGTSEIRHRPAGLVEHLVGQHPQAAVFADSPAFEAVRLAESSFPVIEAPGIVDHKPLTEPPADPQPYMEIPAPGVDETESASLPDHDSAADTAHEMEDTHAH